MAQTAIKLDTEYKRKKQKALDFSRHKNRSAVLRTVSSNPKREPTRFEDIFDGKHPWKRTTGEEMLIIRAFMYRKGLPEVPEHFTVPQFASAMQWHMIPRHAWKHFVGSEVVAARRFISEWARALLPQLSTAAA